MNTQAFNIVLPQELVQELDSAAKREYKNRSELIREAVRLYLKNEAEWNSLFQTGEKQRKKLKITSEKKVAQMVADYRHRS